MRPLLLLLLGLILVPLAQANGLPVLVDPPAHPQLEHDLLGASNAARARFGLPPLQAHDGLARAARGHAQEMASLGYFSHSSPHPQSSTLARRLARAGVPSTTAGENLALLRGQSDLARAAVDGWLESPPHRAALLEPKYTHVGFGAFTSAAGETYIAQVFAREPRRLLDASVVRENRGGFDLTVAVDVPRPLTVVPRLDGVVGEPRTLSPGDEELQLYASRGDLQQLVLAVALDSAGHYQIQDGGWVAPGSGSWQADASMPRSALAIQAVESRRAAGAVFRLDLRYQPQAGELAVLVDERHVPVTPIAPGHLRIYLPSDAISEVKVGEVEGRSVRPFDGFTVTPGVGGPRVRAGTAD